MAISSGLASTMKRAAEARLGGSIGRGKPVRVGAFTRVGGIKVKAHTRSRPKLSEEERKRRASRARKTLIPAAIRATAKKGYKKTLEGLKKHEDGIKSPEKLAGWLRTRPEVMKVRGAPAKKAWRRHPEKMRAAALKNLEKARAARRRKRRK